MGRHDIFFLFDNMYPHNMQKLLQCFVDGNNVAVKKNQHRVHLTYDEDSLRARKTWCCSRSSLNRLRICA